MLPIGSDYVEGLISKMRNILKSTHPSPSLAPEAARTSLGRRFPGAIAGSPDRKFSGSHSPPGGAASYSLVLNRRLAFPILALLALLTAGLLVLLPGGPVQAQAAAITLDYDENGTGPVFTFASRDPEGVVPPTIWSLAINVPAAGPEGVEVENTQDNDDFDISADGVLTFKRAPDYEAPVDDMDGATLNEYHVTVQASDGGVTEHLSWYKVVVNVRDVEEQGVVIWEVAPEGVEPAGVPQPLLQFQAGTTLTARVTDDDGAADATPPIATRAIAEASITWKWYRSSSMSGPWSEVPGETLFTYNVEDTADDNDEGMYLRAVATYVDRRGARNTAEFVSQNPVQTSREDNTPPVFDGSATRSMNENSLENIGAPVTATDADGDILTYSFDSNSGAATSSFTIDSATGQLKARRGLDYEATDAPENDEYEVTVRATDSQGASNTATVTITVNDVNEAPSVTGDSMANDHDEGAAVTLRAGDDVWKATATDPEGGDITWSLSGADKDMFELTGAGDDNPDTAGLAFKAKPDFENPGDVNGDNIYEVTVVASDDDNSGMRTVTVKVTNAVEAGKVSLTGTDPVVGTEIAASLTDSDRVITESVEWTWHRSPDVLFPREPRGAGDASPIKVVGREAAYTPKAGDAGHYLRAQATYLDRTGGDTDTLGETEASFEVPSLPPTGFKNVKRSVVTTAVLDDPANQAPVFDEGSTTVRYVRENEQEDMNIGAAVGAKDGDGNALSYTKDGADAASFDIDSTNGQLSTKVGVDLDYETKKIYTVIVTADDLTEQPNDTASIRVTIKVIDEDEKPVIWDRADRSKTTDQTVLNYSENGTGAVIDLDATDPEGVTPIFWSKVAGDITVFDLDGNGTVDVTTDDVADGALFSVNNNGELTFVMPPDYEEARDADTDNTYKVVVLASDRGRMNQHNWFKVTVTVVEVDEPGVVTWTVNPDGAGEIAPLLQFQPGAILTAKVVDVDNVEDPATWKWYRGTRNRGPWTVITEATTEVYTLVDTPDADDNIDVGKFLRAEASYDGETADLVSLNPVQRARTAENTRPAFPSTTVVKSVAENTARGANIGAAVEAADSDGDILTYTLVGTNLDDDKFDIDNATGRLKVKESLNFEATTGSAASSNVYTVVVRATDSSGDDTGEIPPADATVTITVNDVNEAPSVTGDSMANDHAEDAAVTLMTGVDGAWMATATDPEGGDIAWSLSGADKDMFELTGTGNTDGSMRGLDFKAKPDFEDPEDANGDNIYEVTVVASDGSDNSGMRPVTVKVIDRDEGGKVELSRQNPVVGTEILATLTDSDTYVDHVAWVWYRLTARNMLLEVATEIPGATTNAYTPVSKDIGIHLVAEAEYFDRTYNEVEVAIVGFVNMVDSAVTTKVLASPTNEAPKFNEGATTVRLVAENTVPVTGTLAAANIGDPVIATDSDENDNLSYELDGEDKTSFELMGNQLRVKLGTMLDYEAKDTYTVLVTARDGSGQANDSASITVTIMVVDVDEQPAISEAGLMVSGRRAVSYDENTTVAVETYGALGPDAARATWTVSGADGGYFSISRSGGELSFKNPPNYEMRLDADANNVYMVTVVANDGVNTAMMDVAVTVANVDEPGVITLNVESPGAGSMITATLTDPDGDASNVVWGWQRSIDREIGWNSIPGSTADAYTPVAADGDHYLRAVATYTDPEGTGKRAEQATVGAVGDITVPTFPTETATRSVAENTPAGGNVGAPVAASDDGALTYTLRGVDAASFNIVPATGQLQVKSTLDYETKNSYTVAVRATGVDGATDEITVTITVSDVDEAGMVTLSPTQPSVDMEITASLSDPDGGVTGETWQWSRSMTMGGTFMDITGATSAMYTTTAEDDGYYLQATAMYDDAHGSAKMQMATTASMVTAGDPLIVRYDANGNSMIDRSEVIQAINDYLSDGSISRAEVIEVINLYLSSS